MDLLKTLLNSHFSKLYKSINNTNTNMSNSNNAFYI